jgi:hypothetical protein
MRVNSWDNNPSAAELYVKRKDKVLTPFDPVLTLSWLLRR